MQLHKTSQYAIRILSYIANSSDTLLSAKVLSETLDISYKYLTKIMTELVNGGFILSIRGREGGYKLVKSASEITILEILNYFKELEEYNECILGTGFCNPNNKCILHDQWLEPKGLITKMFAETTLDNFDSEHFKI
ncbi:Rrf2 family transcriptional regulator [Sulfurimonas aquatica]|uniref:Rrf2 family transcriptional regulator n=1 Tax=Sulfurimonas aquatica TaxID=2672570 RepID=A0A975GDL2_9BACT|nr:Rrf2 family transcriptional regulator [Sulfurimonas aquatica]QSZ42800.1 Rrf2 family transcriptional regulator [Sulfurimonas aquatica]